jgi:hypothetical protein
MAPTENSNQSSSESEGDNKSEEVQPETDPSTAEYLESAVGGSDKLTNPSTEGHLQGAT